VSQLGHIEHWETEGGYGFVLAEQTRYFFHITDFEPATPGAVPAIGQAVCFELSHDSGPGRRAVLVRPVAGATWRSPSRRPRWGDAPLTAADEVSRAWSNAPPAGRRVRPHAGRAAPASMLLLAFTVVWLLLLARGISQGRLPGATWPALAALNLLTFLVYAWDKQAARKGRWRIPEKLLHTLALLGGWPAGWAARLLLHHKTLKPGFREAYWGTVLLHCGTVAVMVLHG